MHRYLQLFSHLPQTHSGIRSYILQVRLILDFLKLLEDMLSE